MPLFTPFSKYEPDTTDLIKQAYIFMCVALALTGLTAVLFSSHEAGQVVYRLVNNKPELTGIGIAVALAPIVIVLIMGTGIERLSSPAMIGLLLVLSVCEGLSLSTVFLTYTRASIAVTFFVSAGMFAMTSLYGYLTKADLTKFASILFMGLVGLVLAMLANLWLRSPGLDYVLSAAGVLIFTGLIAVDTHKLKHLGGGPDSEATTKLAVLGALTLYLDFINLFLFLLRIFGKKNS